MTINWNFGDLANHAGTIGGSAAGLAEVHRAIMADVARIDALWTQARSRFGSETDLPFLFGPFSAADVMMSFPLEAARHRAGLGASRPATIAWLEKIHARPAYAAALAAGGPYAYA